MAFDPEVHSADVRIETMTATARLVPDWVRIDVAIEVKSDNDDDAQNVCCVVVLPPTSRVVSSNPPSVVGPTWPAVGSASMALQSEPVQGYVIFELPSPMSVGASRQLSLETRVHESWADKPITAFVYSSLPDPNASNNCRTVTAALPSSKGRRPAVRAK